MEWNELLIVAERIGLAWVLSLPTGYYREKEGHYAGIRTFPIVAMASCGYMLIFRDLPGADALAASSRVLQGLMAGIGFVGGGAIVKDGMNVRGIATAASIWNMGAIGAAIAMGRFEVGVMLGLLNVVAMRGLGRVKKQLDTEGPETS